MTNLLFDLDGTLYDFKATEKIALGVVFSHYGITFNEENFALYEKGNHYLWDQYEKGGITQDYINHERFNMLFKALGINADGIEAGEMYTDNLAKNGILLPGALEFLNWLDTQKESYTSYIITNGIPKTQHGRLDNSNTRHFYRDIFISGEMGVQKPHKAFFDKVFLTAGITAEDSIVIGDTEKSDIQGAVNSGIRSIYINFNGEKSDLATWSVSSFDELKSLLLDLE